MATMLRVISTLKPSNLNSATTNDDKQISLNAMKQTSYCSIKRINIHAQYA